MSINKGMDKEDAIYLSIYLMEYYLAIKKNETMPFATICMDLKIVKLSEISQREANII